MVVVDPQYYEISLRELDQFPLDIVGKYPQAFERGRDKESF